jgi:tetratricopeptide (TPR) repeat protein
MDGYEIARLEEIEERDDGRCPFRAVRHHFGITSFGATAWTAPSAGDRILNEHDETDDDPDGEELYVVLSGHARFELEGESRDAPAGTFVAVGAGVRRTAFAEEPGTTILAVGGASGRAYVPSGWEVWAPLRRHYEAGEYDAVVTAGRKLLAGDPPYAELYYNVACCESLTGRADDALGHLARAIELYEPLREWARKDSDLAALQDEPAFRELTAG